MVQVENENPVHCVGALKIGYGFKQIEINVVQGGRSFPN
jgi:hypothetical protein